MRVLVADDHTLFRDGIVSLLEAAGHQVIAQVGDGRSAVEAALELKPDLVLLDITMPIMDGPQALRKIKASLPDTQVVMLTVSDEDELLLESVSHGASGYLLKSLTAEEFLELLQGLERGEAALTGKMTARLIKGVADRPRQQEYPTETLSPREIELLRLVATGHSNKAIAERVSISENTVKYHMKNILQKLAAKNRTEAVTQAIRAGFIEPVEKDTP
jgi:DNA-binding NarL/FixJ family response regulator